VPSNDRADVVPRRMLELAKDALRLCLVARLELEAQLGRALDEVDRLEQRLGDR
jgi:hypothetical protein